MELSSKQRARAVALAAEIINVGNAIREAAKPPLGTSATITPTSDQGKLGVLSSHSDSLRRALEKASARLRDHAEAIDQLLEEHAE